MFDIESVQVVFSTVISIRSSLLLNLPQGRGAKRLTKSGFKCVRYPHPNFISVQACALTALRPPKNGERGKKQTGTRGKEQKRERKQKKLKIQAVGKHREKEERTSDGDHRMNHIQEENGYFQTDGPMTSSCGLAILSFAKSIFP